MYHPVSQFSFIFLMLKPKFLHLTTFWGKKPHVLFAANVVQSLSCVQLFATQWTLSHQASYLSLSSRVCSNSCSLSWWCYLTILSSTIPLSFCLQSFSASRSFPVSRLFTSGGQSIRASASVLPMNVQDWFLLGLTGLISLLSKRLSVFSSTMILFFSVQIFFMVQLSHLFMTTEKPSLWLYGPLLAKWYLCFWICCLSVS